jgi:membrane-anchored glycerophosphoryl diester phosphodiesterase (GDPDase)
MPQWLTEHNKKQQRKCNIQQNELLSLSLLIGIFSILLLVFLLFLLTRRIGRRLEREKNARRLPARRRYRTSDVPRTLR